MAEKSDATVLNTVHNTHLDKLEESGEPFFVLRAGDMVAMPVLRIWCTLAELVGSPVQKVHGAEQIADGMKEWAVEHGTKVPD